MEQKHCDISILKDLMYMFNIKELKFGDKFEIEFTDETEAL